MAENKLPPYIIQNSHITEEQGQLLFGTKLMLGTPMYGGQCTGAFATGIFSLALNAPALNMTLYPGFIMNESLVQRGRNAVVMSFLDSDADYLMFIDADLGFNSTNILEMILASKQKDLPLIGANYSLKSINWEAAIQAWKDGVDVKHLNHCAGTHVVHPFSTEVTETRQTDLFPVRHLGTGFMLIRRDLFKTLEPHLEPYIANNAPPDFKTHRESFLYFDCHVDPDNKRYMSEDYFFCDKAIAAGVTPHMAMWVNLTHLGTYGFNGCYMCSLGTYPHAPQIMQPHNLESYRKKLKKQRKLYQK